MNLKLCSFTSYRSPSQNTHEFERFLRNLGLNLEHVSSKNPHLTAVLGDFDKKSQNSYNSDKTTLQGTTIENATSQNGLR